MSSSHCSCAFPRQEKGLKKPIVHCKIRYPKIPYSAATICRQMWRSRSLIIQPEYGPLTPQDTCSTGPELGFLEKGNGMRKTLIAVAAVATLAVSTASPALAWRGGWGPGLAAGLIGGAIVGGAIASSPYYYGPGYGGYYGPGYGYGPAYVGGPYGGPCYWQRQRFWDGYGWRVRSVRVCG